MDSGFLAFAPELAQQGEGFDGEAFQLLAEEEAHNFWFRSRNRFIAWAIRRYFANAQNVLEIGCGTGFVLSSLESNFPRLRLAGSELQIKGLIHAATRIKSAALFQMDAKRIPFHSEFDVIGAFDVLEHIEDDEAVLDQMYKAAKSGGGVIITVPQHMFLWSEQDVYARHVRRYNAAEIIAKVNCAGFKVARSTSFVSLALPAMMFSRFAVQRADRNFDPAKELRVPRVLNLFLEKTLDLERLWVRLGGHLPLGGSLLIVAHKG